MTPLVRCQEGDVTWHHGWVQHGAPALTKGVSRMAFTASYFADGALVMAPAETEDAPSFTSWLRDLRPGDQAEHPELPLLAPAGGLVFGLGKRHGKLSAVDWMSL
eukprot:g25437.t1